MAGGQFAEAANTAYHGKALIRGVPFQEDLSQELNGLARRAEQARTEANRARSLQELHLLADRVRFLHGVESPASQIRRLNDCCRALWGQARHPGVRSGGAATSVWSSRCAKTFSTWQFSGRSARTSVPTRRPGGLLFDPRPYSCWTRPGPCLVPTRRLDQERRFRTGTPKGGRATGGKRIGLPPRSD